MTLATATSGVAQGSVMRRLTLGSPGVFVSSFSQPGLDLRIGENCRRGSGVQAVLRFVRGRGGRYNVVCYVDHDGARGITTVLVGRNVHTAICRTKLDDSVHSGTRGSFVGSHMRIIYTAVTFKVKVSGSGMH